MKQYGAVATNHSSRGSVWTLGKTSGEHHSTECITQSDGNFYTLPLSIVREQKHEQYLSIALSSAGGDHQCLPGQLGTQPCQDSVVSGRKGSHGLLGIIWIWWGFESYWMDQTCICLGRMGKLAQGLFFHRTLPCGLASLYLNSIEIK